MTPGSIGLLVIATGRYLAFADQLISDLDALGDDRYEVTVNLFTDGAPDALADVPARHTTTVNLLPVPALRWPEASLYRYQLFSDASSEIVGDSLVYLDADLRVVRPFVHRVTPTAWRGELAGVSHPGFWRPRTLDPRSFRPLGTWETSQDSTAYVAPWRRRRYVCGGVWMGSRRSVLSMSDELAEHVRTDAAAGVTARWHDESHWNWWVAHRATTILDPSFCCVPDYAWLAKIDPYITAVDKGEGFVREATDERAQAQLSARPTAPRD